MNKYRVVKDGNGMYVIQRRFLWWWTDYYAEPLLSSFGPVLALYETKEEALAAIERENARQEEYNRARKREVVA